MLEKEDWRQQLTSCFKEECNEELATVEPYGWTAIYV